MMVLQHFWKEKQSKKNARSLAEFKQQFFCQSCLSYTDCEDGMLRVFLICMSKYKKKDLGKLGKFTALIELAFLQLS